MTNVFRSRLLLALGAILIWVCPLTLGAGGIPKKDVWYSQHYIIMQDFERKLYRDLTEEGRKAFQQVFWEARTSEARAKFQTRLEFVTKNYWQENKQQPWNTDRARTYLLNGSPASIDYDQNVSFQTMVLPGQVADTTSRSNEDIGANRAEVWTYPYDQYFIKYTFVYVNPNQWRVTGSAQSGGRYLGEFETFNKTVTFGIVEVEKYKQDLALLDKTKK